MMSFVKKIKLKKSKQECIDRENTPVYFAVLEITYNGDGKITVLFVTAITAVTKKIDRTNPQMSYRINCTTALKRAMGVGLLARCCHINSGSPRGHHALVRPQANFLQVCGNSHDTFGGTGSSLTCP